MNKQSLVFVATLGACLLVYAACGSDEPSGSSPTITAPTPQSPANGSTVQSLNPTLTVGNAVGAASLRYRFEVATDSGFSNIVAAVDNVPEGSGSTSWRVTSALATGRFFWRARATTVAVQGPFSSAASFDVEAGFNSRTPVNDIYVSDPLTTGMSVGEVSGGEFRAGGWFATDASSYIRYEIPTTPNGFVEFQVTNLRNPNPRSEKRNLMIMWDPTRGDYTENPFRVHIAKFDTNLVTRWHMRLRFIANGQETNTGIDFFDWDPNHIYSFRLEWGAFPAIVSSQRVQSPDGRPRDHDAELRQPLPTFDTLGRARDGAPQRVVRASALLQRDDRRAPAQQRVAET